VGAEEFQAQLDAADVIAHLPDDIPRAGEMRRVDCDIDDAGHASPGLMAGLGSISAGVSGAIGAGGAGCACATGMVAASARSALSSLRRICHFVALCSAQNGSEPARKATITSTGSFVSSWIPPQRLMITGFQLATLK